MHQCCQSTDNNWEVPQSKAQDRKSACQKQKNEQKRCHTINILTPVVMLLWASVQLG